MSADSVAMSCSKKFTRRAYSYFFMVRRLMAKIREYICFSCEKWRWKACLVRERLRSMVMPFSRPLTPSCAKKAGTLHVDGVTSHVFAHG
jgi:hypothetical protein